MTENYPSLIYLLTLTAWEEIQGWDIEKTRLKKPGFFQTGFMGFFKIILKKPTGRGFFQKFDEF